VNQNLTGSDREEKEFWFQEAAFDILQWGAGRDFAYALATYRALCAIASETESEPAPDRDGKPFRAKLFRVARMVCQPCAATARRIRRFARLKLIDPVEVHADSLEPLVMRLRLLDDTGKGGAS
jgi:hypothetical protein